jgi:hypothetical protein
MKLYDGGKVFVGLIIFVGLFVSPFIFGMSKPHKAPDPKLDTPVINELAEEDKKCVDHEGRAYVPSGRLEGQRP